MNGTRVLLLALAAGLAGLLIVGMTLFLRVRHDAAARAAEAAGAATPTVDLRVASLEDQVVDLERLVARLERQLAARRAAISAVEEASAAETSDPAAEGAALGAAQDDATPPSHAAEDPESADAERQDAFEGVDPDAATLPDATVSDPWDGPGSRARMADLADRTQNLLTLTSYQRQVFLDANAEAYEIRRQAKQMLFDPNASLVDKRDAARALRQSRAAAKKAFLGALDGEQRRTLYQLEKERLLPKGWLLPTGDLGRKSKKKKKPSDAG